MARPRRALDRRLGLRRRRRHPGRPEGVRPLRRPRHDRDHRPDRAEHGGRDRRSTRSRPSSSSSRSGPSPRTSASTRSRSGCSAPPRRSRAVREALELLRRGTPIVIDPVMVAESGAVLLDDAARRAIVTELLPLATVITPNLPEARVLAGDHDDVEELARALHALGPANVVVTGGHREEATDVFFDGRRSSPPRRAPSRRRRARLRLHALERACRPPRARASPRWKRRGRRGGSRRRRCATGSRHRRGARAPWTCSGVPRGSRTDAPADSGAARVT